MANEVANVFREKKKLGGVVYYVDRNDPRPLPKGFVFALGADAYTGFCDENGKNQYSIVVIDSEELTAKRRALGEALRTANCILANRVTSASRIIAQLEKHPYLIMLWEDLSPVYILSELGYKKPRAFLYIFRLAQMIAKGVVDVNEVRGIRC